MRRVWIFVLVLLVPSFVLAQEEMDQKRKQLENISRQMTRGAPIELEALEIRAKIHEPTVIYILDRPKLDVEFDEREIRFTPRISDPVAKNRF
jgi:hypothetical protein